MRSEDRIRWALYHAREAEGATFCCAEHEAANQARIETLEWILEED